MEPRLGPFALVRPLARGGMGEVWLGRHHDGTQVAVKVITARARIPGWARLFQREVHAVARLDHPHVILLLDHGTVGSEAAAASCGRLAEGAPYLVMERVGGGSMQGWARERPRWGQVRAALLDLLDALAHAHAQGVVHRDLKPANVLLGAPDDPRPGLKLVDFGVAWAGQLHEDGVYGTVGFMAPEQLEGRLRDQGPWTDLYAVGCLAWWAVCGQQPFRGRRHERVLAHIARPLPPLDSDMAVPPGLADWIAALTVKAPADRVAFAADARAALQGLGASAPAGDQRVPEAPVPPSWRRPDAPMPPLHFLGAGLGLFGLRPVRLVGRRRERDRLWRLLGAVRASGRARAVWIRGAAGAGKSRLAQWLAVRAHELGAAAVWSVAADPAEGGGKALRRLVAGQLGTEGLEGADLEARLEAWSARLPDGPDPSALRSLVAITDPDRIEAAQERVVLTTQLLAAVARQRPLVVLIDDVHWSLDVLDLVERLLSRPERSQAPILFVLTCTDEQIEPDRAPRLEAVASGRHSHSLRLGPLGPGQTAELLRRRLRLEAPVSARVERRVAGNPLFAVQLVLDWVQRGLLVPGEHGWTVAAGTDPTLPDDLHAVWSKRVTALLVGLGPGAAEALEVAAVLGMRVDLGEWRAACGGAPCEVLLERLLAANLVETPHRGEFRFRFSMLRAALERNAAEQGRLEAHHARCADMLRASVVRRHLDIVERLGEHLLASARPGEAVDYLIEAVDMQHQRGRPSVALALADRCEEAMREAAVPPHDPRWGDVWLAQAELLGLEGELERSLAVAARARAWASRHGERRAEHRAHDHERLVASLYLSDDVRAKQVLDELVARLRDDDEPFIQADVRRAQANALSRAGHGEEATRLYRAAADKWLEAGEELRYARTLRDLASHLWQLGAFDRAEAVIRTAYAVDRRLGSRFGMGCLEWDMAGIAHRRGDDAAAGAHYRRAAALFDAVGIWLSGAVRTAHGFVQLGAGRYEAARDLFTEALEELPAGQYEAYHAQTHAGLVASAARLGDWKAWDRHARVLAGLARPGLHRDLLEVVLQCLVHTRSQGQPRRGERLLRLARLLAEDDPVRHEAIADALAATAEVVTGRPI